MEPDQQQGPGSVDTQSEKHQSQTRLCQQQDPYPANIHPQATQSKPEVVRIAENNTAPQQKQAGETRRCYRCKKWEPDMEPSLKTCNRCLRSVRNRNWQRKIQRVCRQCCAPLDKAETRITCAKCLARDRLRRLKFRGGTREGINSVAGMVTVTSMKKRGKGRRE